MAERKLGRLPPRPGTRLCQFEQYVDRAVLPPVPASLDWLAKVSNLGAMKNDSCGDCTCAAAGHLIQAWTANARTQVVLSDQDILHAYEAVSGYKPATGQNDNGAVITDVLDYWTRTGVGGDKILAYVALEPGNHNHIQEAMNLFGGAYLGVDLPLRAQQQLDAHQPWTLPPGWKTDPYSRPGTWGGHAVPAEAYDGGGLTCITWGETQKLGWSWFDTYCSEAYAVVSHDWWQANNQTPSGFDLPSLLADFQQLGGGTFPIPTPPTPPPPPGPGPSPDWSAMFEQLVADILAWLRQRRAQP